MSTVYLGSSPSENQAYLAANAVNVKGEPYNAKGDNSTDDSAALNSAFATGKPIYMPAGIYKANNLTQNTSGQPFWGDGGEATIIVKNANGDLFTGSGSNGYMRGISFRGDASTPTYTGDNVVLTGDDWTLDNCESRYAYGRALKATGQAVLVLGSDSVYQTADATSSGYDIELGVSGTATLYHRILGTNSTQHTGGILLTDTGSHAIIGCEFGKLDVAAGSGPSGVNGGRTVGNRIHGTTTVGVSNAIFAANQFGATSITFASGTSGCVMGADNTFESGCTITNSGNNNNVIARNVSTGTYEEIRHGDDNSLAVTQVNLSTGCFAFPKVGVGNSASATTPGSVTKKIEVFDLTGSSLGFLAVYGSIT